MYVGCNMVVVANVDNGGGSLVGWSVGGRLPPSAPSPSFPTSSPSPLALPPSLPPSLLFSGSLALSPLPREDIKKPTMESAGDGEERKGDGAQRV